MSTKHRWIEEVVKQLLVGIAENQEEKQPFDYKAAQANEVGF